VADEEGQAPGWDAIDAALAPIYGGQQPRHVGYHPPRGFAGGALQGCSAYAGEGHWHYISYGLSELYLPEPDADPRISGWGFELTMRVPRGAELDPPGWPYRMLNELAKYVISAGVGCGPGHRFDLRAPVTGYPHVDGAPDTGLTVYAVLADPQLGQISTPNGQVTFLQLVGVTAAEKEQMIASSTAAVLAAALAEGNPLLITDPGRA
jgi:hypothetical protein